MTKLFILWQLSQIVIVRRVTKELAKQTTNITFYLLFINLEKVRHLWWVMMHRTSTLIVHQTVEELHEFHLNSNLIKTDTLNTTKYKKKRQIRNASARQSKHVRGDRWRTARRLTPANIRYKLNWKLETKCNARILIWQ